MVAAGAVPVASGEVTLTELAGLSADVIIMGEYHDNPEHHLNQSMVAALVEPSALVFEMFGPQAALRVTPAIRPDALRLAEALDWEAGGWPDFAMYHPIFLAAPRAVVFGGAMPQAEVRRTLRAGAAQVFGDAAPLFGLDRALPQAELAARMDDLRTSHCDALPDEVLPGMVEAQRVRDAALARAVIAALAETGGPVLVITGNGHARTDWGIPPMLARALPSADVVSVAQFEAPPAGDDPPYDLWLVTAAHDRGDPCASFRP